MNWIARLQAALTPATLRVVVALLLGALLVTVVAYQFPSAPILQVGSGADTPFVQGFSFRENYDGGDFRWSLGNSELRFWDVGAQSGELHLRLAIPAQQTQPVQLWANSTKLADLTPTAGFQAFTFPISSAEIGPGGSLIVKFVSATFSAPPDPRTLGIQVDSAQFSGTGIPVLPAPAALLYLPALVVLAYVIARVWIGQPALAIAVAILTLILGAVGLVTSRVATAYFLAPLFWFALLLFIAALAFAYALRRFTASLNAPTLSDRTLRLLFLVMSGAFAFRFLFATGPGYIVDVQDYVVWSYKTVTYGLGTMYAALDGLWISDQSPGLNYILHVMGLIYRGVFSPDFLYPAVAGDPALRAATTNPAALADPVQRTLLRLPMLFADILTGALVFTTARKYVSARGAWLAGLVFWFNPAVLWNGSYWGQTDAIHALLVLVSLLLLVFPRRIGWAFFILGIAAFTKPQALIFGPLLLLAAFRVGNLRGVARALVFGGIGALLVLLPVVLTGGTGGLLAYFGDTVGHHPILSANAHNLWWFVSHGNIDVADTGGLFAGAPISYRLFSILLFGVFYAGSLLIAWRASLEDFFGLGAFVAFAFFMLPTEIHENYGYALLPLLAVAMTRERQLILLYAAISMTMTLNYALHDPGVFERAGLSDPDSQWAGLRWLNSFANLIILSAWTLYLVLRESVKFPRSVRHTTSEA